MEMNGAPGKNTVGSVGDICVDTTTNNKYICIGVYEIIADTKIRHEYQWKLIVNNTDDKIDAKSVNGYSIWVGTTEELNVLTTRDPKTLYFETNSGQ